MVLPGVLRYFPRKNKMKPFSTIAVANKIIPKPKAKSRLPLEVSSAIAVVMTRVI